MVSHWFTSKKSQKKVLLTGFLLAIFVTGMLLPTNFNSFNLNEEVYDTSENLQSTDLNSRPTYITDSEENWIINGTFEDNYIPWNNGTYDTGTYENNMTTYWTGDPAHQNEPETGDLCIFMEINGTFQGNKWQYDQNDKVWWNQTVMVNRPTPIPEIGESSKLVFDYYIMAADNETKLRERIALRFWVNNTVAWERNLEELPGAGSGWHNVKITSIAGMMLSEWLNLIMPINLEFKVELVVILDGNSDQDFSNTTQIYADNIGLIIESEDTNYNLPIEITSTYDDHVNFSLYYTYFDSSEMKLKLVENAQIEITYNGTPWMGGYTVEKHTDPFLNSYVITLQTPQTIDPGNYYPLWINSSATGFERQRFPITVNVVDISTSLDTTQTSLTKEIGSTAVIEITFRDTHNNISITGANVTYEWDYGSGQLNEVGNGVYNFTIDSSSLEVGTYIITVTASKENYETQYLQLTLEIVPSVVVIKESLTDQLLDYLPYLLLLIIAAFTSVILARTHSIRKMERLDKEKIRRIMVIYQSFAVYDQTPAEVVVEEDVLDKDLVSGFFSAIKEVTEEVARTALETMKVYPAHPYYFVYTGTFYCALILSDKPSARLEKKIRMFSWIAEEKYGKQVEERYQKALSLGFVVPEIRLNLDGEVIDVFGVTPTAVLQDIVSVSLSYEEIEKLKVKDNVKVVLKTGSRLTDQKKEFSVEELIQVAKTELNNNIRAVHEAIVNAMQRGLFILVKKASN